MSRFYANPVGKLSSDNDRRLSMTWGELGSELVELTADTGVELGQLGVKTILSFLGAACDGDIGSQPGQVDMEFDQFFPAPVPERRICQSFAEENQIQAGCPRIFMHPDEITRDDTTISVNCNDGDPTNFDEVNQYFSQLSFVDPVGIYICGLVPGHLEIPENFTVTMVGEMGSMILADDFSSRDDGVYNPSSASFLVNPNAFLLVEGVRVSGENTNNPIDPSGGGLLYNEGLAVFNGVYTNSMSLPSVVAGGAYLEMNDLEIDQQYGFPVMVISDQGRAVLNHGIFIPHDDMRLFAFYNYEITPDIIVTAGAFLVIDGLLDVADVDINGLIARDGTILTQVGGEVNFGDSTWSNNQASADRSILTLFQGILRLSNIFSQDNSPNRVGLPGNLFHDLPGRIDNFSCDSSENQICQ